MGQGCLYRAFLPPAVHQKKQTKIITIMKTKKNNKRLYKKPRISRVKLDNEISLVMQSTVPMENPQWGSNEVSGSNRDPFKPEDYYG